MNKVQNWLFTQLGTRGWLTNLDGEYRFSLNFSKKSVLEMRGKVDILSEIVVTALTRHIVDEKKAEGWGDVKVSLINDERLDVKLPVAVRKNRFLWFLCGLAWATDIYTLSHRLFNDENKWKDSIKGQFLSYANIS